MARGPAAVAAEPPQPVSAAPGVVSFSWGCKAQRPAALAAMGTLVAAMAEDPVNTYLLGGTPSARFAKKELKGYVKALPRARHFIATPDAAAVALWQLLPEETPANELLAGWTRWAALHRGRVTRAAHRSTRMLGPCSSCVWPHA
jgi:hypothetical protein